MKPALIFGLAGALAVAGCTETKFADMLGAGKQSPDETSVRTGQALSLPPDLQLRQPGAVTEDGNLNRVAARPVSAAPDAQALAPDAEAVAAVPDTRGASAKQSSDFWASEMPQQQQATASGAAPGSAQARKEEFWSSDTNNLFTTPGKRNPFWDADPNAPKVKRLSRDEALAKYGISKTKPDGTPKTENELDAELKAVYLAEKRKNNPDYGTIKNIGAIFSDG